MDLLQSLAIFQRVAETGSFTRAADGLGLATSSVSAAIQKLEERLGVGLFQRTTRRVRLTGEGELLYERAGRLLSEATEVDGLFRAEQPPEGLLRVEVPARIARRLIAPALPDFLRRYPDVRLELGSTDKFSDLLEEGIDCVLRVGESGEQDLASRPLGRLPQTTCASPALLVEHGMPTDLPGLALLPAVHFGRVAAGKPELWEYLDDRHGRTHELAMHGRVAVSNAEAYIACCLAGLGVIQVPRYDVAHLIARGELREILIPGFQPPSLPIAVLYPPRRRQSRLLRLFVDWLESQISPHAQPPSSSGYTR